ncbi:CmcJ/NvfI family oxidoreductase [Bradyrhizobium sp. STM 3561]|uniref:CmcJ/NvfI family oxidoreductase n=1 Tax=Bradyrhizobium sp. STM 3561 TaxID=578923 RepID=UPI00388F5A90
MRRGRSQSVKGTARVAHVDYAPIAAPVLAARENVRQGIPLESYSRLMIIQAWRVISRPPHDLPLAVCDSSSVPESDLRFCQTDYNRDDSDVFDGRFWTASPHHSPQHRWYYFPDMSEQALLLWNGYDSEQKCYAPHVDFDNRRAFPIRRLVRVSKLAFSCTTVEWSRSSL